MEINNKEDRAKLAKDTLELLKEGKYKIDKNEYTIKYLKHNNKFYNNNYETKDYTKILTESNKIILNKLTTTESARQEYLNNNRNIGVLNFASALSVGGGFLKGSSAQEESICYRSNLYQYLEDMKIYYTSNKNIGPLYTDSIIYSKGIMGFRDDNYEFVKPYYFDVLTCPAVMYKTAKNNKIGDKKINEVMFNRIEKIIKIFIENGNKTIILGAYGCGAFGNNPKMVARAFYKVLIEDGLISYFDKVIFSIYDESNYNYNYNYNSFAKFFKN